MKTCPSCRAEVPPQVAVCPFCNARFADAPARPRTSAPVDAMPADAGDDADAAENLPPPRQNSHLLQLPPAPMVIMGGSPAREARRRRSWWLAVPVLALVGLVGYGLRARGVPLPSDGLEPVSAADVLPCGDAPDCVLVYVAPWDDASATTLEMLAELRAVWADDGPVIEVVVGAGELDDSRRLARAVRGSTWLDPSESMPAALDFDTVPTWFRVADGRVVRRVDGTYLPIERQVQALGLPIDALTEVEDERRVLTGEPGRRLIATPADDEGEAPADGEEASADPPTE